MRQILLAILFGPLSFERISEFPFVSGAANVLIWPSVRWKKHVYNEEGRLNFRWAGQIYQLHRGKASTKRKQKHIGGADTKYWWRCVPGVGRGTTLGGRIWRSKQSGQSKKWNNKKLLENMPSSAVIYSRERSEHKEAKTKTRTRTRKFIGGIPILCWGIGAGAKEEEDKEDLITFPILLSASSTYNTTLAQVFKTATRPTSHKLTFAGRCRNKEKKRKIQVEKSWWFAN